MLRTRVILGLVFSAVVLGLLWLDFHLLGRGIRWGPAFFALVGLATVTSVHEVVALLRRRVRCVYELPAQLASLAILGAAAWEQATGRRLVWDFGPAPLDPTVLALVALILVTMIAETVRIWAGGSLAQSAETIAMTMMPVLYVALLSLFVVNIRFLPQFNGCFAVVMFVAVVKASDIGAFFTGKAIGRRKMCPTLSPNKTLEGLAGGFVLGIAVAMWLGAWLLNLQWWESLVFGGVVTVLAVLGDLAESLLKRAAEAKDSGAAFPAFGGVLDIMDSVLLSAPAAYLLLVAFAAHRAA